MDSSKKTTPFVEIAPISTVLEDPTLARDPPSAKSVQQSVAVDAKNTHDGNPQPRDYAKVLRFPVKQSVIHISAIIVVNTLSIALIIICLHGATWKQSMNEWGKRAFNFVIILLSAILSLGIGYLLDQLGLLARGQVLVSNPHTELSIRYIIRGSMTAVAHLLWHHVFHRPRTFNRVTLIAVIYLAFSILARLSVALLGLTFNIDAESIHTAENISISRWPLPNEHLADMNSNVKNMTLDTLFDYATVAVRIKTSDTEAQDTNLTSDSNHEVRQVIKKAFSAKDIAQTLVPGQPIASYEYRLREFRGNTAYPSNRTVVVQTQCYTYVVRDEPLVPGQVKLQGIRQGENVTFTSEIFNPNKHPLDGFAAERMFIPPESVVPSSCGQLCVRIWLWDKFLNTPGEATYQCENKIQLPLHLRGKPEVNIRLALAEYFLRFMADSEAKGPLDGFHHRDVTDLQGFTNFANAIGLDVGYSNGEIWVAAVLARFTGVLVLYLDQVLPKVQISEGSETIRSRLSVRWSRVAMLAGVMTSLQIILALGTIYYCRGSVLIPDEVSPLSGLGHLQIPRASTFTSIVSRSSFGKSEESTVRAWFSLRKKEDGIRRWILEFDKQEPDLAVKGQRSIDKNGPELGRMQNEV